MTSATINGRPTVNLLQPSPEVYDARCQAYEAEGLTRSDAQAAVDAEILCPELRAKAHGLPQELADAGYRLEFGDSSCPDGGLVGRWWWTRCDDGADVESSDDDFGSPEEAVESVVDDLWPDAIAYFGLCESEEHSDEDVRQYVLNMLRSEAAIERSFKLLEELVGWHADKFEGRDDDPSVNGGDAVDFINEMRDKAKAVLAARNGG